jgi:putative transposase
VNVEELAPEIGTAHACAVLSAARATVYRRRRPPERRPAKPRPPSPRALKPEEREAVLTTLNSERFVDKAPAQVHAVLLDEGRYVCSPRTMYRILAEHEQVRERRDQRRHPVYAKPELVATGPNQVWSWDITKLRGPTRGSHFSLYVILDVFSRCVVGWRVSHNESAAVAEHLVRESCRIHGIERGQLTLHADRGSPQTSKSFAILVADLGVAKTHSRPQVSNDNPFSEAQFKTLKYCPQYPERFGSLEDARQFCREFFDWYNNDHRHSGIGMLTPAAVHSGLGEAVLERRRGVLEAAYAQHPERFVRGVPKPAELPDAVWINKPAIAAAASNDAPNITQDIAVQELQ